MDHATFCFPYGPSTPIEVLDSNKRDDWSLTATDSSVITTSPAPICYSHLLTRVHRPAELVMIWTSISPKRRKKTLKHCFKSIKNAHQNDASAVDAAFAAAKLLKVVLKLETKGCVTMEHRYAASALARIRDKTEFHGVRSIIIDILWATKLLNLEESEGKVLREKRREDEFLRARTGKGSESFNLAENIDDLKRPKEAEKVDEENVPLAWRFPEFQPSFYHSQDNPCHYY